MRRGDTIIEVIFAITVFSFVSIMTISLMNSGVATTEASLELTTARSEMAAQAEALRFIHNGYVAEYQYPEIIHYVAVWQQITTRAIEARDLLDIDAISRCEEIYNSSEFQPSDPRYNHPFVINTRRLNSDETILTEERINGALVAPGTFSPSITPLPSTAPFVASQLAPRIVFTNAVDDSDAELREEGEYRDALSVEGIWVTAVKGDVHSATIYNYETGATETVYIPRYYDLYVRSCWIAPGRTYPTKLATIVRLYNPSSEVGSEL